MRNVIPFLAVVLLFVSCTNKVEVGTPFVEGQEVTLMASIVDSNSSAKQVPDKQRVSGIDVGAAIDLIWDAGDQILVSVGDKSAVFTLSSGENSSTGEFAGKMPADGSEYSVSYPVNYRDDVLTHQTYVENGFGNGLMKMSTREAGTLGKGFLLHADNALLGLQLIGNQQIGKIVLTNPTDNKTYTLHCANVELSNSPTIFYIIVPAGKWDKGFKVEVYNKDNKTIHKTLIKEGSITFSATSATIMPTQSTNQYIKTYRYGFTQEQWEAANNTWGHAGRGHAPIDQSCIQGTMVYGIRLKVIKSGVLNVYKIPSLIEKTEDNFEHVITLKTDKTGLQDFDFPQPIYIGKMEYLVFGKPSEEMPTLIPAYHPQKVGEEMWQQFIHYIGSDKKRNSGSALMVEFY